MSGWPAMPGHELREDGYGYCVCGHHGWAAHPDDMSYCVLCGLEGLIAFPGGDA